MNKRIQSMKQIKRNISAKYHNIKESEHCQKTVKEAYKIKQNKFATITMRGYSHYSTNYREFNITQEKDKI